MVEGIGAGKPVRGVRCPGERGWGPDRAGCREVGLMTEETLWGSEQEEGSWDASGLPGSWPGVWEDAADQAGVTAQWEVLVGIFVPEVPKQGRVTEERTTLRLCASTGRETKQVWWVFVWRAKKPGENNHKNTFLTH